MRRIGIVVLALMAAFAAPLRAACGATCAEPPAVETPAAEPACHEAAREHAGDPAVPEAGHCSHDHSASVRPAPRPAAADVAPAAVALLTSPAIDAPILIAEAVDTPPPGSTRGSPPARLLPLRI